MYAQVAIGQILGDFVFAKRTASKLHQESMSRNQSIMKMRSKNVGDVATRIDFCRAFEQEMQPLYLLSFLLTASHADAERCLTITMDEVLGQQESVFKESVLVWIKYRLIKIAIQLKFGADRGRTNKIDRWSMTQPEEMTSLQINAITLLPSLSRFVFVMSTLEKYSSKQCSLLLDCSQEAVLQERVNALKQLQIDIGGLSEAQQRFRQTA